MGLVEVCARWGTQRRVYPRDLWPVVAEFSGRCDYRSVTPF